MATFANLNDVETCHSDQHVRIRLAGQSGRTAGLVVGLDASDAGLVVCLPLPAPVDAPQQRVALLLAER